MGRAPCCDKANVKKGPWSPEEDEKLKDYIDKYGTGGNWIALPHKAGLRRCGKSCRLRWLNYLRPNIKHGDFTDDEDRIICSLFASIGSRWSIIAAQLPGRTDNDIKNYWNTKLKKKLLGITSSSSSQKRILQSTVPACLSSASLTPSAAHTWPDVIGGGGGNHEAANYYYTTQGQLIDSLSLISSHLFNSTTATSPSSSLNTAAHEGYNHSTSTTSSMQNYQVQDMSFLRFGNGGGGGGDQASSSSSDGSSTYDYGASNVVNINNNNNNNLNMNMNMNYFSSNCVADNPLDDSLEEIKQLISTTNLCNNFFVHEIKTEEKVTYY